MGRKYTVKRRTEREQEDTIPMVTLGDALRQSLLRAGHQTRPQETASGQPWRVVLPLLTPQAQRLLTSRNSLTFKLLPVCCQNCTGRGCTHCNGDGLACPACKGAHMQRVPYSRETEQQPLLRPCVACCIPSSGTPSGYIFDGDAELDAIVQWLERWALTLTGNNTTPQEATTPR